MKSTNLFFICSLLLSAVSPYSAYAEKDTPLEELKKTVFNFDEVSPGIYRSGIIFEENAPLLNKLGVKTVINLHNDRKQAEREREFLKSYGIQMIWLPWAGIDKPSDKTIEKSLKLMDTVGLKPVLVHCQRGAERTGVTVAAWRVTKEGWTAQRAFEEMKAHKFRIFRYGHLKKYLYDLAYQKGDSKAKIDNVFERAKINTLSAIYEARKLNPFHCSIQQDKILEN